MAGLRDGQAAPRAVSHYPPGLEKPAADRGAQGAGQVRTALGPVRARQRCGATRFHGAVDVHTDRTQSLSAGLAESEHLTVAQPALARPGVRQSNAQAPRKVVVAEPRAAARYCAWRLRRYPLTGTASARVPSASSAVATCGPASE